MKGSNPKNGRSSAEAVPYIYISICNYIYIDIYLYLHSQFLCTSLSISISLFLYAHGRQLLSGGPGGSKGFAADVSLVRPSLPASVTPPPKADGSFQKSGGLTETLNNEDAHKLETMN